MKAIVIFEQVLEPDEAIALSALSGHDALALPL